MIIVRLKSGLGNQLFQYAFGLALSEKTGQPLYFDTTWFDGKKKGTPRSYELDKFTAEVNCAIPPFLKYRYVKNMFWRFLSDLKMSEPIRFFKEAHFYYDDQIFQKCEDGVNYYDGYWQSPQYFNAIRPLLLEKLRIKVLSPLGLTLVERIQKENAISIHVRRGDYAQNKRVNVIHGLCTLDYYQQAIELLLKEEKDVKFYVFSDDMEWTKANLKIDGRSVYYVEHTSDATNHEDLYLMSICKHQIIANSSFSWWGAWLNDYSLKRVIAPKKWFADASINTYDLIPAEWIQL